jgi:hypothetical protein
MAKFVALNAFTYSPNACSGKSTPSEDTRFPREERAQALKACWRWAALPSIFMSGIKKSMKPLVPPGRGSSTKLETKWHCACVSVGMRMAGITAISKGDLLKLKHPLTSPELEEPAESGGSAQSLSGPREDALLEEELAAEVLPFLLAFCALRSVALVSLRSIRSNSSLYPGHWRRDLVLYLSVSGQTGGSGRGGNTYHWLQAGFVSSHYRRMLNNKFGQGHGPANNLCPLP